MFLAADRFDVSGLKRAVEVDLISKLSAENVAEVLVLFDAHECAMEGFEAKAIR